MTGRYARLALAAALALAGCSGLSDMGTLDLSGDPEPFSPSGLTGTYNVRLTRGAGSPPLTCGGVTLQVSFGSGTWSGCTAGGTPGAVTTLGGTMTLSWTTGASAIVFTNFTRDNFTTRASFTGPRTAGGAGPPGLGSATFTKARQ